MYESNDLKEIMSILESVEMTDEEKVASKRQSYPANYPSNYRGKVSQPAKQGHLTIGSYKFKSGKK